MSDFEPIIQGQIVSALTVSYTLPFCSLVYSTRTRQRDRRTKEPNYVTIIEDTLADEANGTYKSFNASDIFRITGVHTNLLSLQFYLHLFTTIHSILI